ncbi:MAG: HAMP domain-containing sensor histidine kinase [bacterium]
MDEGAKPVAERPILRRVRGLGIFGFSLTIFGCWLTEYMDPPFSIHQVLAETGFIALLGFFTIRRTLHICEHLERAAGELREKNQRLREKTVLLEANRRKLLELDHLKSEFVSMVSHELRTPLTSIIGFARTLRTLPLAADQSNKYLGIIEDEGKRLAEMVEEYLDVSKIEAGAFSLHLTSVDVLRLVQEVVDPVHHASRVRIETRLDPATPSLTGDRDRLKRVLLNLLANAVRYTAEGTAVDVSTAASGDGICFSVHDCGPGLSRHAQERVFERFYRGSDTITERTRGSGLGLAIARSIVEKHGGRIWVESEPGRGATFRFWIPLQPAVKTPAPPAKTTAHAASTGGNET